MAFAIRGFKEFGEPARKAIDCWTEHLCLERHEDGSITLSIRSHKILAEAHDYMDEDGERQLPDSINGKAVYGVEGDYVLGDDLLVRDDESEVNLRRGKLKEARDWLENRGWVQQPEFDEAWLAIRAALLYTASDVRKLLKRPRVTPGSSRRSREIVIQYEGLPETGFGWFELVFLEWNGGGYSIYRRSDEDWGSESATRAANRTGRLNWRAVYRFLRGYPKAQVPLYGDPKVVVDGVEAWQRELIVRVLMRGATFDPVPQDLSDKDLKYLYERLGGFQSDDATSLLYSLGTSKCRKWLRRKSLASTTQTCRS